MARNPRQKQTLVTKKHLARQQREQLQTRYIIIGTILVIVAVVGLIGYGVLNDRVLKTLQPVAIVNGDRITTADFQAQVRFARMNLVQSAVQTYQIVQMFGNNPQFQNSAASQLYQVQTQLQQTQELGNQVLEQMIQDKLIRQEAERRGITVTSQEVDKAMQDLFGYFPDGTPTPEPTLAVQPTSTFSPLQMTLTAPTLTPTATLEITPTATLEFTPTPTATATMAPIPTETLVPTITPTQAPTATPTEYTLEGYQTRFQEYVDQLQTNVGLSEKDLRRVMESQLYREKILDVVLAELGEEQAQEQVWARHILVADEATAAIVKERLDNGEDWSALAAEFSTDESNKNSGGDLGWFAKGAMVKEFEDAAFALGVGEISEPVQTSFGFHIIQVLGHENRPLLDSEYEQVRQQRFNDWLQEQRDGSEVEIRDIWQERVPAEPVFPAEIEAFLQQLLQQQVAPTPSDQ